MIFLRVLCGEIGGIMLFHKEKLKDVHPELVRLVEEYGKDNNVIVVCGHRNKEDQNRAYAIGNSKLQYPKSAHNSIPSKAVDLAPTETGKEINWKDMDAFRKMGSDIEYLAKKLGIKVFWGGRYTHFRDLPHFELVGD